ncbi:hypothetical protein S245_040204, partial [Arachis hypogaea]
MEFGSLEGPLPSKLFSVPQIQQVKLRKEPQHDNLNRLDPPRCLKLLPVEELEHLDIHVTEDSNGPVNQVLYASEGESSFVGRNATFSLARFNLFTGNQTLEQRDTSFEIKESMMVHCGFYSLNGGFKISDEDKTYMQACKVVVSTCAFGGGDDLYQPIGMLEASLKKWYAGQYFNRIEVQRIGFDLTNQTYKPPKEFGPYYFITFPYAFPDSNKGNSLSTGAIIGIAVGSSVVFLSLKALAVYAILQKKCAERAIGLSKSFASWAPSEKDSGGFGGYEKVYKGVLPNGKIVAIKQAQQGSMQGGLEFKTEI